LVRSYTFWQKTNAGDQPANFKQGNGDYGGIAGGLMMELILLTK
jgi:hypothetical protein